MSTILDGKKISQDILEELRKKVASLKTTPILSIILVGEDPSSVIYVNQKKKRGEEIGIGVQVHNFLESVSFEEVSETINRLNNDKSVSGVIVQLPLPTHLDKDKLLNLITPKKDVDGLGHNSPFEPATPLGIMELLKRSDVNIKGKKVVVMGQSDLVGKPVAKLLKEAGGEVGVVDINTQDPNPIIKQADILVVAIGKSEFVTSSMVKEGVVVVDVGVHRTENGLVGDVDSNVAKVASKMTPVPGGVGPMTVVTLLQNVVKSASN